MSQVERPEQLTLEVGRWSASVMSIAVTVVFVLVVGMLAKSNWANNGRAEDWRARAIVAEEAAGGLRVVLADRSRTLNQRTRQANALIETLASSRGALRQTKSSVGRARPAAAPACGRLRARRDGAAQARRAARCTRLGRLRIERLQPVTRRNRHPGAARQAEGGARDRGSAARAMQQDASPTQVGAGAGRVIRGVALGLTLFVTLLLTGCGIVVTDEAPTDALQLSAPPLVEAYTEVEALAAPARTLSLRRARQVARKAALRVVVPSCDDDSRGTGLRGRRAHAGRQSGRGARRWLGARLDGEPALDRGRRRKRLPRWRARRRPRRPHPPTEAAAGAKRCRRRLGGRRHGARRQAPDAARRHRRQRPGKAYGARTKVLRLTSDVREGDAGPVLDAKGRLVGVVFGVDERTTLGAGDSRRRAARACGRANARGARRLRRLTDRGA